MIIFFFSPNYLTHQPFSTLDGCEIDFFGIFEKHLEMAKTSFFYNRLESIDLGYHLLMLQYQIDFFNNFCFSNQAFAHPSVVEKAVELN